MHIDGRSVKRDKVDKVMSCIKREKSSRRKYAGVPSEICIGRDLYRDACVSISSYNIYGVTVIKLSGNRRVDIRVGSDQ